MLDDLGGEARDEDVAFEESAVHVGPLEEVGVGVGVALWEGRGEGVEESDEGVAGVGGVMAEVVAEHLSMGEYVGVFGVEEEDEADAEFVELVECVGVVGVEVL